MIVLEANKYGKSRVRLVRVRRKPGWHDFREWTVEVLLEGDFESCFKEGDNRKILPTDTMKNTVYSLAHDSQADCMEEFGKELIDFLLRRNPQVSRADVSVSEKAWEHLIVGGKPHATTFVQSSGECQTAIVTRVQGGGFSICSGFDNLVVMKTAASGFEGFIQDSLTTLAPTNDRLFGTAVCGSWRYAKTDILFAAVRTKIRDILLAVFAEHVSKSVQHTLYAMGEAVLESVPEVEDIELIMPNRHCLLVDLSRFGQENRNEVFVPIDEPHGHIEARMRRQG